jgi:hypothetical protein
MKVLATHSPYQGSSRLGFDQLISSRLWFNELIVHTTRSAYGIEVGRTSMSPLEGAVFLDGYLW